MKFGLSKICITPKIGTKLFGQPKQLNSDGKYTDLYARSFYLNSKGVDILITSCDLLALTKEITDSIRERINKRTGIDFLNIMVHTTHTHAGPSVIEIFNKDFSDKKAQKRIIDQIVESGISAFNNRIPGKIGLGKGSISDISFNRRYIMKDGTVEMHPHKDDPNILEPEGPNDPELNSIILFYGDKPVGVIANFQCHLTSLERNNTKFSADFPYYAEKNLQEKLGDNDFILLYLNGPCGNLCQVDVANRETIEVGDKHSQKSGKSFANVVGSTIENCKVLKDEIDLNLAYSELKIPIRKITDEMLKEAEKTIKSYKVKNIESFELSNYGIESYHDKEVISAQKLLETDFWKNMSANEIVNLFQTYKNGKKEVVPLTVATIGSILLVAVSAELFVEYSIKLKSEFKNKYDGVIILELTNGWVGYVPTKKAFSYNSGYEVQFLNSSKLYENAGDMIIKEIMRMEKKL